MEKQLQIRILSPLVRWLKLVRLDTHCTVAEYELIRLEVWLVWLQLDLHSIPPATTTDVDNIYSIRLPAKCRLAILHNVLQFLVADAGVQY